MKFLLAGFLVVQLFVSNAYAEDPIDAVNDVAQELNLDLDEEFYFSTEPTNEPVSNPPIVKVESTSIKLLGKGVVNRETGESIGLACIVQNCSELRMFYVDSTHTSGYLVGSIIRVTENQADPTRKQIKTTLRKLSQEFRGMKNKNVGLGTYLLKVFGTFTAVSGVGIVVGSTIGVVFLPAMLGTSYLFFRYVIGSGLYKSNKVMVFSQKNGWNWAAHPKKVSSRNFKAFLEAQGVSPSDIAALSKSISINHVTLTPTQETSFQTGKLIQNIITGDQIAFASDAQGTDQNLKLGSPFETMKIIYFKADSPNAYMLANGLTSNSPLIEKILRSLATDPAFESYSSLAYILSSQNQWTHVSTSKPTLADEETFNQIVTEINPL